MMRIWIFSIICSTSIGWAQKARPASDYDVSPEEHFLKDSSVQKEFQNLTPQAEFSPRIELTGEWGKIFSKKVYEKYETHFQWDASSALDWSALRELNQIAISTWEHILEEYKGDLPKFKSDYVRGRLKSSVKREMDIFFQSAQGFVASTMVEAFSPDQYIKCFGDKKKACPEKLNIYFGLLPGSTSVIFGYDPKSTNQPHLEDDLYFPSRLLEQLPQFSPHPLLVQAFLEILTAGYPLNYGTVNCGGVSCALRGLVGGVRRIVLDSDDIEWSMRGYSNNFQEDQRRERYMEWTQNLLSARDSHRQLILPGEWQDPRLLLLRQSLTVSRLLNFISTGPLQCESWGLWPEKSVELLGMISQSEYSMKRRKYESQDLDFLSVRLSRACQVPYGHYMITSGSTDHLGGPYATSRVGAWRQLYNQNFTGNRK